ncbi:hypothetical protein HPB49_024090 [Dermacentor silvarum]|uniref:Uncharacterized protein n=1 Tax=Dermacentor silvarum TaxID=543639 RepID=A0ACB8CIE2_DERSI|nr:hypothetical protein HPB49_024090 [Dermacentor silvarum]
MAIIYLQAFVFVILMGKLMRKVFFGQLRAAEMEHLIERSWYAVTETCLAFTVFRDDFSPKFVALFTLLLFLKCFHWLAEDRVDYMERSPVISYLFHVRVIALLLLLGFLDYAFVAHAYHTTLTKGASVQVVFGFEYAILLSIVANIYVKYFLHTMDLHSENPGKTKLFTCCFIKVALYLTFMAIMIKIHTFPLFAIRPMYLSMRAFKKAFNDVIMSRRAIRNMNTLYPDATPEELASADNVCIICREEMVGGGNKRLPCSHIFHTACLRSWFQRQQTCPTCRMDVLRQPAATAAAAAANNGVAPPPAAGQAAPQAPPNMPGQAFPQLLPPPPPVPPEGLEALSAEELSSMEGQEREQIAARIRCLRNIQTLLDAACAAAAAVQFCRGQCLNLARFKPTYASWSRCSQRLLKSGEEDAHWGERARHHRVVKHSPPIGHDVRLLSRPPPRRLRSQASQFKASAIARSAILDTHFPLFSRAFSRRRSKESAAAAAAGLRQSDDDPNAEVRRRRLQRFSQGAMPNGVSSPDAATESNGTNDDSRHPH